jgi:hypothetical protein
MGDYHLTGKSTAPKTKNPPLSLTRALLTWWRTLALHRTFLNNACGLVRKRTESCGLTTLRQHLMTPGAKTPLARLQQNIRHSCSASAPAFVRDSVPVGVKLPWATMTRNAVAGMRTSIFPPMTTLNLDHMVVSHDSFSSRSSARRRNLRTSGC